MLKDFLRPPDPPGTVLGSSFGVRELDFGVSDRTVAGQ